MKIALQAQIPPQIYVGIQTPIQENKTEGGGTSGANRAIGCNPTICITLYSTREALKLYRMGYIPAPQLEGILSALTPAKKAKVQPSNKSALIQRSIEEHFGMNIALLQSRTRRHEVVFVRQFSVWLHQQHTKMTHKAVSLLYYGNRDHSNSIRACQKIEDYRSIAGEYKDTILEFLNKYSF
jgi:hypothetical protein